ncbi:MAG: hypothetical protein AMJ81_11450 [Phycisphaerae bacterium SM23_33]|nr:MAG: hypothetical protein AMJ81_11450 [Phycisphaerae bacterium SM23_33]
MILACLSAGGCVSPGKIDSSLIARYQDSIRGRSPQPRKGTHGPDLLKPVDGAALVELSITTDPKTKLRMIDLALEQAIRLALLNSLDIRIVSFQPAISREEMVKAAAEFDYVVFGDLSHIRTDQRSVSGFASSKSRVIPGEVGIRTRSVIGTQLELKYALTRTTDNSTFTMPQPQYESMLSLQLTQPLLRFGGLDVNLAALRLARLGHTVSLASFREQVEKTVTEVQTTYWALVQARKELEIQQRLLDKTIETRDRVEKRKLIDATDVEVKQTEAAVESRRAVLLRARENILNVQDRLGRLLADPRMGLTGGYMINPVTPPVERKVTVDPADQLVNALKNNPVLEQARLGIESADISVQVARNGALPVLNLTASTSIQGLKDNGWPAVGDMLSLDFWSHSVGLLFEYPLGNRGPEAELRKRTFERLQAATQLQNLADQVAVGVNGAIRRIGTAQEEVKAQRAAVAASRIQLGALEDTEKIRGRLTPEFLQVKLQAQESLAAAERAELEALISYNNALAELARITGTTLQERNIKLATESAIEGRPLPRSRPAAATRPK